MRLNGRMSLRAQESFGRKYLNADKQLSKVFCGKVDGGAEYGVRGRLLSAVKQYDRLCGMTHVVCVDQRAHKDNLSSLV